MQSGGNISSTAWEQSQSLVKSSVKDGEKNVPRVLKKARKRRSWGVMSRMGLILTKKRMAMKGELFSEIMFLTDCV